TEASEFDKIYKLGVISIPTNRPMVRADQPDLVYRTEGAKYDAIIDDIVERYGNGQPVLVGTVSVEKSERLSGLLKQRGIAHTVLNAKHHANEAHIVAQAGRKGAITVATNMAGRGTDIMLGGSVEFLADEELRANGLDPIEHSEEYEAAWPKTHERIAQQVKDEHDEVNDVGGLYVVGTERHESRRIDNQLRGRSGRQGDPGESRFYLSLEDDLMRLFKSDWVDWVLTTMKIPDDVPIENKRVTGAIASAQGQVESQNFETRKNVLKYDDVMSRQREVIYGERRQVLEGADLHEQVRRMIDHTVEGYVVGATAGFPEEWDLPKLWTALKTLYPVGVSEEELEDEAGGREMLTRDYLVEALTGDAQNAYDAREELLGADVMRELERRVLLSVLDRKWREHLYEMDYLREGIGLRAYSQRDPLVEYQREGFELFTAMRDSIEEESVGFLFNVEVNVEPQAEQPAADRLAPGQATPDSADQVAELDDEVDELDGQAASGVERPEADLDHDHGDPDDHGHDGGVHPQVVAKGLEPVAPTRLAYSAPTVDGDAGTEVQVDAQADEYAGVSRNEPCPCGSGRKFKRCHGDLAHRTAQGSSRP
ncbi:MAG: SEC-C domain-containing protein, partial [Nocardioidaceae bacterium]|nr:SEC-C domain-containing protein [Nocardioidaceae bacterium]